jgi:hypothetical protein
VALACPVLDYCNMTCKSTKMPPDLHGDPGALLCHLMGGLFEDAEPAAPATRNARLRLLWLHEGGCSYFLLHRRLDCLSTRLGSAGHVLKMHPNSAHMLADVATLRAFAITCEP